MKYFVNNTPQLKQTRRKLRINQTEVEALLWSKLRNRRLNGYRFVRQNSIGRYILDFYCPIHKLGIELDGSHHAEVEQSERDKIRTRFLNRLGIKVIRFWNNQVNEDINAVLDEILDNLKL